MKNPYRSHINRLLAWQARGRALPLGGLDRPRRRAPAKRAPCALIFSPHPDDECIVGGLALRLQRECGWRVVNVAVTQGSRKDRQASRWAELTEACAYLGFELIGTAPGGLEDINRASRERDPHAWRNKVELVARILREQEPRVIFFPHDADWNSTHIGTHLLVADALLLCPGCSCAVVETEFWGAMAAPNLMVEIGARELADMMAALSFHVGEVQRNPYHLTLPAWMQDNVRRGGEIVGGQGGAAPPFNFATLYRLRRWTGGAPAPSREGGRILGAEDDPAALFTEQAVWK